MIRNYPPADFIEAVWGFSRDALKPPSTGYSFPKDSLEKYEEGAYKKYGVSVERTAYAPLLAILQHLVTQIRSGMKVDPRFVCNNLSIIANTKDKTVGGRFAGLKPDFLLSWILQTPSGDVDKLQWLIAGMVGELKKKPRTHSVPLDLKIDIAPLTKVRYIHGRISGRLRY